MLTIGNRSNNMSSPYLDRYCSDPIKTPTSHNGQYVKSHNVRASLVQPFACLAPGFISEKRLEKENVKTT